jgi:hypothetical protein
MAPDGSPQSNQLINAEALDKLAFALYGNRLEDARQILRDHHPDLTLL